MVLISIVATNWSPDPMIIAAGKVSNETLRGNTEEQQRFEESRHRLREAREKGVSVDQLEEEEEHEGRRNPENFPELFQMARDRSLAKGAPYPYAAPGAYAAASAQRIRLAAAGPQVPNADGIWRPYGRTPLITNHPDFGSVNTLGLVKLAGRIDDLVYDPDSRRLFAALGSGGGIWTSRDKGDNWRPIGDSLPTQVVGSVGWTPASGGRIIALTGEPTFGHYSQIGLGAFYSDDLGATWSKASGVPVNAFGFKVAVDATKPNVVYAATSRGLYRSTDAGRNYEDVIVPTGDCAGTFDLNACLFANVVTDVIVQAPDKFGNTGGAVMAAVGWRASNAKNPDGSFQATGNGIYVSPDGAPGSFSRSSNGLPNHSRLGRLELGPTVGPDQNHDYVYLIVQDAELLRGGFRVIDAPEDFRPGLNNTVLNGVYVSGNFGQSWTLMADQSQISENPLSGSALPGLAGIQSWYNLFIAPDPTRQDLSGVPTRLTFGLEEVWQNEITTLPQNGRSSFKVIGRYFGGTSCVLVLRDAPACPTNRPPSTSTTTHPDQQDALYIPEDGGGVTLAIGNDGGYYKQTVSATGEFDNGGWGEGYQEGFHTLLPYHASMAKDGTVWMGLQDNGTAKITPQGQQYMTFGGDGFFVGVDPDNSQIAYGETTFASMRTTTDGGKTWRSMSPPTFHERFSNPFVMDPTDARHLITAGNPVAETVWGPETGRSGKSWVTVFNLGTRDKPGLPISDQELLSECGPRPIASCSAKVNQMTALDVRAEAAYVGFCSACDVLASDGLPFRNGLATNVGGDKPAKKASTDGWHIAAAKSLPNRMITAVAVDPQDPNTVYVGLGGYSRRWTPPGSFSLATGNAGTGHIFKSTDAGATFANISGNLIDSPVTTIAVFQGQLAVGTDLGTFISIDLNGGTYSILGSGMPVAPISSLQVAPQDPRMLVAATFGRGVYVYVLGGTLQRPLAATGPFRGAIVGLSLLLFALMLMRFIQSVPVNRRIQHPRTPHLPPGP